MGRKPRIRIKNFKEALKDTVGNHMRIASNLSVSRGAVTTFIKKHPKLKPLIEEEKNKVYDVAEDNIDFRIIKGKNVEDSKWKLLNTKRGQSRGYGSKLGLEHTGEVTQNIDKVTVEIIDPQGEKDEE